MHTVRLRPAFVALAVGFSALFLGGPLAVAVLVLIFAPFSVAVWVAPASIAFAAVLVYAMSSSNQWVELNDGVIRAKRLVTRQVVTRHIRDIVAIKDLNSALMGPLENLVLDALMKTSNRGYELRFRDGTKIGLVRGDMAGLDEFLVALADQLRDSRGASG
jgi:lipopolysaccharide export LptBFGC system permease protein LptF